MVEQFFARREEIIRVAQDEILTQEWGISKQFFAVNRAKLDGDGRPVVAHVAEKIEAGSYSVYFQIDDEPFFFVVVVDVGENGSMQVTGAYDEARVRVYLAITSATLTPAEITARIGFIPNETHAIGDHFTPLLTYQEHRWEFHSQRDLPGSVEEKMVFLLDAVRPVAPSIIALKPECDVKVVVVFEGWGGDPQFGRFNFSSQVVAQLAEIGAGLYFDLYSFGPQMLDEEPI